MKCRAAAVAAVLGLGLLGTGGAARGHFQVMLPASDIVGAEQARRPLAIDLCFTHPMEQGPVMKMAPPRQFCVLMGGKKRDLSGTLSAHKVDGKTAFTAAVPLAGPGDYVFYLEPAPYWEAAEQKWIVHYTKVVVDVLGAENGWDALVGLPVEIEPLVRPYGLWTGNTFRGIVTPAGQAGPRWPRSRSNTATKAGG